MYHKIRKGPFVSDLVYTSIFKTKRYPYDGHEVYVFEDKNGNELNVYTRGKIDELHYIPSQQRFRQTNTTATASNMMIKLEREKNHWDVKVGRWNPTTRLTNYRAQEVVDFLMSIDRPQWYPGKTGVFKNKNRERRIAGEILDSFRSNAVKALPDLKRFHW